MPAAAGTALSSATTTIGRPSTFRSNPMPSSMIAARSPGAAPSAHAAAVGPVGA
ncbi:hypothetical protein P9139_19700 [Curtobacterium flaccumfaciens]|nr:hypothetical protein P9139_19700 [Curtobacterium flaccumfaciens]